MRKRLLRRPSAAMVVAVLAVVAVFEGGALASSHINGRSIKKNSIPANRVKNHALGAKQMAPLAWHDLTLMNGWTQSVYSNRTPAWAIDDQGIVHLRGAIQGTTSSTIAFVLPAPARPSADLWLTTNMVNAAPGRLDVDHTTGNTTPERWTGTTAGSDTAFTNLDGITYVP